MVGGYKNWETILVLSWDLFLNLKIGYFLKGCVAKSKNNLYYINIVLFILLAGI